MEFDESLKARLPEMMEDLKSTLYGNGDLELLVDFSPDSDINTAIRKSQKSDIINFAMFYEGNVYNKLINKVSFSFS